MKASIIGFGRMGRNHLEACKLVGVEIISICDTKLSQEDVSLEFPNISFFNQLDDLLNAQLPELVIISTTAPSHFDLAKKVMDRGIKYVLCEKPLVNSLQDAYQLREIARAESVNFAVNHQMRFMDGYRVVKQLAEDYPLGELRAMNVSGANIGLSMNGTHYFEAFSWLTNSRITHVTSWLDNQHLSNPRGEEFKDFSGQVLCRNQDNQRLYLDIGSDLGHEIIVDYAFSFGHVTVNELRGTGSIVARMKDQVHEKTQRYGLPGIQEDFTFSTLSTSETSAMTLSQLVSGGNYPTLEDGLHTISVAFASIKSHAWGSLEVAVSDLRGFENSQPWA